MIFFLFTGTSTAAIASELKAHGPSNAFYATVSNRSNEVTSVTHVNFDEILVNDGDCYTDGIFTTKTRGLYLFTLYWHVEICDKQLSIFKDSGPNTSEQLLCKTDADNYSQGSCSALINLEGGERAMVKARTHTGRKPECELTSSRFSGAGFLGYLVHPKQ